MTLEKYDLIELSKDQCVEVNGGVWSINPVAAYLGACVLAYELGHAVGKAIYNMLN